jgi:hypothetical protein
MAGQFDDERTVELKAQVNSAFAQRAGRPGYGADGWKTPGLAAQAERDEGRRMEQGQKQVMRVAQQNAKKALRAGDMEAWQHWSQAAGGKTFGIGSAQQNAQTAGLGVDRQTQNAFRLNEGVTADPNKAGASNGTPVNDNRAAQEAAEAIEQSAAGPSATGGATTPSGGLEGSVNAIPERGKNESSFAYAERLAQLRGKQQGVWGGAPERRNPRAAFVSKINELRSKEGGMSDSDKEFAQSKGKSLGLNDDQIFDALDGQSDLSPKAVIARAGERKEKEKDKAQAAKITSGLLAEVKRIPSPMDINSPFPVTTKFDFNGDPGPAISDESPAKDPNPMDDFTDLTASDKKPKPNSGQKTSIPNKATDESSGLIGSVFSDLGAAKETVDGVSNEFLKQGAYNALDTATTLNTAYRALKNYPDFIGSLLPGNTGRFFGKRHKINMGEFNERNKANDRKNWERKNLVSGFIDKAKPMSPL